MTTRPTTPESASSRRWLFGPVPDLLLGCGVGYGLVFLLQLLDPSLLRAVVPAGAAPLVILLSGTPHYGATLLRVYERAEDRRAYAFFTVWVTLLLAALFVAGVRWAWVGSILLTVYLVWSPWHYSGQNYGVALMFLGRRGVKVSPWPKRLFHASFFLSFVLTFLATQSAGGGPGYAPFSDTVSSVRVLSLGIPQAFASPAILLSGIAYAVCVVGAFGGFLRSGGLRDVAPAAVLTATQSLWFAVPVLSRHFGLFQSADPFAPGSATYAFLWIAAGHSVQYLWVTTFYVARESGARDRARYLGKCLLAGAAIWNVPLFLFGPLLLGWSTSDVALTAVVASAVNLHHFLLDGAIWKLRDGRVAQVLIRARQAGGAGAASVPSLSPAPSWPWLRTAIWAAGLVSVAFVLARTYEREVGFREALKDGNLARAEQAAERLSRIGLDGPEMRIVLARAALQMKRPDVAQAQFERSLQLRAAPDAFIELGLVHEAAGRFEAAARAYDEALALSPGGVDALHRKGVALLALGRDAEAREVLEQAAALAPDQKLIAMNLARARGRTAQGAAAAGEIPAPAPPAEPPDASAPPAPGPSY